MATEHSRKKSGNNSFQLVSDLNRFVRSFVSTWLNLFRFDRRCCRWFRRFFFGRFICAPLAQKHCVRSQVLAFVLDNISAHISFVSDFFQWLIFSLYHSSVWPCKSHRDRHRKRDRENAHVHRIRWFAIFSSTIAQYLRKLRSASRKLNTLNKVRRIWPQWLFLIECEILRTLKPNGCLKHCLHFWDGFQLWMLYGLLPRLQFVELIIWYWTDAVAWTNSRNHFHFSSAKSGTN